MTNNTSPALGIWFHLAQAARLIFWLVLIGFLMFQQFDASEAIQWRHDGLFDQIQRERKAGMATLIERQEAADLAVILSEERWTNDFPLVIQYARQIGLTASRQMPRFMAELKAAYRAGKPSSR